MERMPKVALLIETSRGYGRGLLRGIVRYARLHGPWSFFITPGDFEQTVPRVKTWGGTGVIARIETPRVARALCKAGLPTIALDLSEQQSAPDSPLAQFSEIHPDPVASVNLAVDHLMERSFSRFAFVGIPDRIWSRQRQEAFSRRVKREGFECHVYCTPRLQRDRTWDREQAIMSQWLTSLPKPIGLMACNDDRGRQVLEACLAAGVEVPEDVAVVGMDDDDLLCELIDPALSSVALNTMRGGYEAAALLDQMMQGKVRSPQRIVVEPLWVVTRQSTDVLAIEDRRVSQALRFIRENAGEPIRVRDVLRVVPICRRALEMRFRRAVGRSINSEIQNAHFRRAKELLVETDYPIARVAEMAGYRSASYMGQIFRRKLGKTPARYRFHLRNC